MYYANIKNNKINDFYVEDVHGLEACNSIIKNGGIKIDEELWQHLLTLGECKFVGMAEEREYTIIDKDLFERVIQPVDTTPKQPSLEERLEALELLMMGVI